MYVSVFSFCDIVFILFITLQVYDAHNFVLYAYKLLRKLNVNQGGEIKLPTGENFSHLSLVKLTEITDAVNALINFSLEGRLDLNNDVQPEHHTVDMPIAAGYYVNISREHVSIADGAYSSVGGITHAPTLDVVGDNVDEEERIDIMIRT